MKLAGNACTVFVPAQVSSNYFLIGRKHSILTRHLHILSYLYMRVFIINSSCVYISVSQLLPLFHIGCLDKSNARGHPEAIHVNDHSLCHFIPIKFWRISHSARSHHLM
jgi:hypothetical protein